MDLQALVESSLNSIGPFTQGTQPLDCVQPGQRFFCELTALDTLACAFALFDVGLDKLKSASIERLRQVAETLSRRLTYLLEPISPVEVDAGRCVVQLRSSPPQRGESGSSYYELLVSCDGHINLCRFVKEPQTPRRQVPAHVTREVFLRLVADFSAAAS